MHHLFPASPLFPPPHSPPVLKLLHFIGDILICRHFCTLFQKYGQERNILVLYCSLQCISKSCLLRLIQQSY